MSDSSDPSTELRCRPLSERGMGSGRSDQPIHHFLPDSLVHTDTEYSIHNVSRIGSIDFTTLLLSVRGLGWTYYVIIGMYVRYYMFKCFHGDRGNSSVQT